MATKQRVANKSGVTPGKMILIGVLAVVLIVVVVVQIAGSSSTPTANARSSTRPPVAPRTPGRRNVSAKPTPAKPRITALPRKDWPVMTIGEVVGHDPFVLPASLLPAQTVTPHLGSLFVSTTTDQEEDERQLQTAQQRERELAMQRELEDKLREIGQKGVAMVFLGGGDPVARIGTQDVRVGDVVDGLRIAEIRTNGSVVVELADDDR